jgi:hypothetical protein
MCFLLFRIKPRKHLKRFQGFILFLLQNYPDSAGLLAIVSRGTKTLVLY